MTTTQVKVKQNKFGKIKEYNLLITLLKDYGYCLGCKKDSKDLFLTLHERTQKKIGRKKHEVDDILQYCYDCASDEMTRLSKKNVQFVGINPKEKQRIISKVLGELAFLKQREEGNALDEDGKPLPNKHEEAEKVELERAKLKQRKELKKKGIEVPEWKSEDGAIFNIDKHRDYLMIKAEIENQVYEKVFGKLPMEPSYRKAKYAPILNGQQLVEVYQKASKIIDRIFENKINKCFTCQRAYLPEEVGNKINWTIEGNPTVSLATSENKLHNEEFYKNGKLLCSDCVEKKFSIGFEKISVPVEERPTAEPDKQTQSEVKCDECDKKIDINFLEEQGGVKQPRLYCSDCYELTSQGIFRCRECWFQEDKVNLIDTKKDKFGIDLNHNIFCENCWEEDEPKEEKTANPRPDGYDYNFAPFMDGTAWQSDKNTGKAKNIEEYNKRYHINKSACCQKCKEFSITIEDMKRRLFVLERKKHIRKLFKKHCCPFQFCFC